MPRDTRHSDASHPDQPALRESRQSRFPRAVMDDRITTGMPARDGRLKCEQCFAYRRGISLFPGIRFPGQRHH